VDEQRSRRKHAWCYPTVGTETGTTRCPARQAVLTDLPVRSQTSTVDHRRGEAAACFGSPS